jgi:hypothetical protein
VQELYVVGFTSDLRNLILSRQKGVKSGGFAVTIDDRLWGTLKEVDRLQEGRPGEGGKVNGVVHPGPKEPVSKGTAPRGSASRESERETANRQSLGRASRLTPKEIQIQLRAGLTVQEVAHMAGTDTSWVERFVSPILAERKGIVEAVKAGVISRPRRGRSSATVGDSILANLLERKINLSADAVDDGWKAVRRDGTWQVTFHYSVRGQDRDAQFTFDAETRAVKALNPMASQIAWRPPPASRPETDSSEVPGEVSPGPVPFLTAKARSSPPRTPSAAARADSPADRAETAPKRNFRSSVQPSPAKTPARPGAPLRPGTAADRARAIGAGAGSAPARPAAEDAPRARGPRPAANPQAASRDDGQSLAGNSSGPRLRRLQSEEEEDWKSAVARSRANRKSGAAPRTPQPPPPRAETRRPHKKRLPDDWLLGH